MPLPQQVVDLKAGCADAVFIPGFNTDGVEADAVNRIPTGDPVHHCCDWDISVFILVAAEDGSFGGHHTDHLKALIADAHLLANG